MDTSRDEINYLTMHFGGLQVSPKQMTNLNQRPAKPFVDRLDQSSSVAGYQVLLNGYADYIYRLEETADEFYFLETLLRSLRSNPRPLDGQIKKGSLSTYQHADRFYKVQYRIANGQVVVFNIELQNKLQIQRDKLEKPGLYNVRKNSKGIWNISAKVDKVTTSHAAVNGMLNNLTKATWLMGSHIEHAYGKNISSYTLFHNPSGGWFAPDLWESTRDKMGFSTPVTKQFSQVLIETQADGNKTKWVAHSQGGLIFTEAVRYALNGNSSTALHQLKLNGARHPDKGSVLDNHKVSFHGNANNIWRSKKLIDRAGIDVLAIRIHDYDVVGNLVGGNTSSLRKLTGSLVYLPHIISGSIPQSPHTTIQSQKEWEKQMHTGPGTGRTSYQQAFEKTVKIINNYLA
jgi:hypothetical protein